jgi:uncharacterized SAM-binding protein YcdF (DUF218 family)
MTVEAKSLAKVAAPRRLLRPILISAGIVLLIGGVFILFVGRWLVVEDPLEKAQAIAVLSGGIPTRAVEASNLYRQGFAPEVWLTRPLEPGEALDRLGISYVGEESYDTRILLLQKVPAEAIHTLEPSIVNTADEIRVISAALEQKKGGTIIIVTSKVHTRRTRILCRKLAARGEKCIVRGSAGDTFNPARWWRTTGDALDVVREVLGILNAWAGMPVRPGT